MPGHSVHYPDGTATKQWDVSVTPTVFLVDADGVLRERWDGRPRLAYLQKAIDAQLREKK